MKRFASFVVEKRYRMLVVVLALTLASVLAIPRVTVNTDMTKYLPDDSPMKIGIDRMEEEFPELETAYTLRVMLTGLPEQQKEPVKDALAALPYVDSVAYKAGDADYNKDHHTLYIVSTLYDFGTAEELALEAALTERFADDSMLYIRDSASASEELPPYLIALALAIVMIIMFTMCASWLEPVLFLFTIGCAIGMNMGSNLLMGSISEISASIASLLQLVLSMDYSIILINRYRQEQELTPDKPTSMKHAISNGFSSIAGSAVTTIAGLLVLVFMNFKIGKDLGIVLAKGVFFSFVYVITLLPALILLFDQWIVKTAKKVPHLKMAAVARFSYRFRHAIVVGFALLLVGAYLMQGNTENAFTLDRVDPIADIFPPTNTVLVLFDNEDEQIMTETAGYLEQSEHVKSVASLSTTIGKPYTSAELAKELEELDLDSDLNLDASVLDILYYYRYRSGRIGDIATGDFLRFVAEDVANNPTFADELDDDIRDRLELLSLFAEREELLAPRGIAETADLLSMDAAELSNLFVYYFGDKGGVPAGTMTLPQFTRFLRTDLLGDPDFSGLLDEETRDRVDLLETVTDREEILTRRTAADAADKLDMDPGDMELLYLTYFGRQGAADSLKLTFPQFSELLTEQVLQDERFADALEDDIRKSAGQMAVFADPKRFRAAQTSAETAKLLDMEPEMAHLLYALYFAEQGAVDEKELTVAQLVTVMEDLLASEQLEDAFDGEMRDSINIFTTFGTEKKLMSSYSSRRFAHLLDIEPELAAVLYAFYDAREGAVAGSMTVADLVRFLQKDIAGNRAFGGMLGGVEKAQIEMLGTFTEERALLAPYTGKEMARLFGGLGLDQSGVDAVYAMSHGVTEECPACGGSGVNPDSSPCDRCGGSGFIPGNASGLTMTLSGFIDALSAMGGTLPPETAGQLEFLRQLKEAALSGQAFSADEMAPMIGMDAALLHPLYRYRASLYDGDRFPGVVLYDLVEFIVRDLAGSGLGGEEIGPLGTLLELMDAALDGQARTAEQLADLVGMEPDLLKMLYAYREMQMGRGRSWRLSLESLVDFVTADLAEGGWGGSLDPKDLDDLTMAGSLMEGTLAGRRYTPEELAEQLDREELDPAMLKILYAYHIHRYGDTGGWLLSLQDLVDFILEELAQDKSFGSVFDEEVINDAEMLRDIVSGTLRGTAYSPGALAALLDMDDSDMVRTLYLLRVNRYGDTSGWRLPLQTLISFIHDQVLPDEDMAKQIGEEDADRLGAAKRLVDSVMEGGSCSAAEMAGLLDGFSEELGENPLKLLYVYYFSRTDSDPAWTFSLYELFHYLLEDILHDPLFANVFDEEIRTTLQDSKADLDEAVRQLAGPNYSRMLISTTYPGESEETYAFIDHLLTTFDGSLGGNYYIIGDSPMSLEMSGTFDKEMLFITLLTAVTIFMVVAVTFRSLSIPAILVLIIQCGVYITISLIGLQGYSIYYLALLIVQSILMGATIDYGILFTSYYMENRQTLPRKEALAAAYDGSSHTIFTSGSIMVLGTGVLGYLFENPTIGEICRTISRGAVSAITLIIFVLPGILAVCDRWVCKRKKNGKAEQESGSKA